MLYSDKYLSFMGKAPKNIPHWEHWSNPDAETYLTGIDYYEHPKLCREKLAKLYPQLELEIPQTDEPVERPGEGADTENHTTRWGASQTDTWEHGEAIFKTAEDVFNFSPLEKGDFTDWPHVVVNWDYSSEDALYEMFLKGDGWAIKPPESWGAKAPVNDTNTLGTYNTMFMWPMLTFGWELFLETCLDERFERIMDEFAELNRRLFSAFARLPHNFVLCHDDIVITNGPVCSPDWMRKYIFPRYEEFWGIVKAAGKEVLFMSDGCVDVYVDDIMACGARGIISEPYTDYKAIAKKYPNAFLAGEGDSRILQRNNYNEIKQMVEGMTETAQISNGYMMCIGNHIPWNVPGEAVKTYLDLSAEMAYRKAR